MNWRNVRLITVRELRDQLRDRRTMFVIAVLPLMLYPLLGLALLQVAQFLREHPSRVWLVALQPLPDVNPLVEDGRIRPDLCRSREQSRLLELVIDPGVDPDLPLSAQVREALERDLVDVAVYFPLEFVTQLHALKAGEPLTTGPEIFYDQAKDRSRIARDRMAGVLDRWRQQWVRQSVANVQLSEFVRRPFAIAEEDVSKPTSRRAMMWSRSLPFVMLIWALTGAFYPAIDLCAGEKERGTLETLLSSPAAREEIVWAKLISVMVFSVATSLLNLLSIMVTGLVLVRQFGSVEGGLHVLNLSPPPFGMLIWMVLVLVPISALFGALAIALAAMARSSKEGQYYLIPLMMICMPLMLLPMLPSVELTLGNSLIPVTGVVLLLRSLIEGEWLMALKFSLPVAAVTALACWLAIVWAVRQFNDENVLFREGEQFGIGIWLTHLVRDRTETPALAHAFLCGATLLILRFFGMLTIPPPSDWNGFVFSTAVVQLALVATPALLMTIMLTRNVQKTLGLRLPRIGALAAVVLLAVLVHPVARSLGIWVYRLYPLSEPALENLAYLESILRQASLVRLVLVLGLIPAICEELAFRGFILSGMRRLGHRGLAIFLTSVFFGVAHAVLQQSFVAVLLGLVLGFIAIQTSSLVPCIAFHFVHNTLQATALKMGDVMARQPWSPWIWQDTTGNGQYTYTWPVVAIGAAGSLLVLWWLNRLPDRSAQPGAPRASVEPSAQATA